MKEELPTLEARAAILHAQLDSLIRSVPRPQIDFRQQRRRILASLDSEAEAKRIEIERNVRYLVYVDPINQALTHIAQTADLRVVEEGYLEFNKMPFDMRLPVISIFEANPNGWMVTSPYGTHPNLVCDKEDKLFVFADQLFLDGLDFQKYAGVCKLDYSPEEYFENDPGGFTRLKRLNVPLDERFSSRYVMPTHQDFDQVEKTLHRIKTGDLVLQESM